MSLPPLMRAAVFGLALVLLLIAGAAISGDDKPVAPRAVTVTVTTPATTTAPAAPARSQVVRGKPREPFSASGARFEVVPSATASWARQVREDAPRRGSRWVTIAVRSRNVSRRDLVLRSLGYRLRTSAGVVLGPRFIEVAEGPARARRGRLPTRSRASVHLGFELPSGVRSVSLAFEPGGLDEPTALVALGVQA